MGEATIYHCEQPSIDIGYVGKYCLSETTRQAGYKVVLTGEGADEHFAGYSIFLADFLSEPDATLPDSALVSDKELRHKFLEEVVQQGVGFRELTGVRAQRGTTCPAARQLNNTSSLPAVLVMQQPCSLYAPWVRRRFEHVDDHDAVARNVDGIARDKIQKEWHPLHAALYAWNLGPLPNNILTVLGDRTEMAHGVEARPPFLDHVLAEYVNGLSPSVKIRHLPPAPAVTNGTDDAESPPHQSPLHQSPLHQSPPHPVPATDQFIEKWVLREVARPFITDEIYARRKQPYVAPARFARDGPIARFFRHLVSRENVEELDLLDWGTVGEMVERAFAEEPDATALRGLYMIAGWVTLGKVFGLPKAEADI